MATMSYTYLHSDTHIANDERRQDRFFSQQRLYAEVDGWCSPRSVAVIYGVTAVRPQFRARSAMACWRAIFTAMLGGEDATLPMAESGSLVNCRRPRSYPVRPIRTTTGMGQARMPINPGPSTALTRSVANRAFPTGAPSRI